MGWLGESFLFLLPPSIFNFLVAIESCLFLATPRWFGWTIEICGEDAGATVAIIAVSHISFDFTFESLKIVRRLFISELVNLLYRLFAECDSLAIPRTSGGILPQFLLAFFSSITGSFSSLAAANSSKHVFMHELLCSNCACSQHTLLSQLLADSFLL